MRRVLFITISICTLVAVASVTFSQGLRDGLPYFVRELSEHGIDGIGDMPAAPHVSQEEIDAGLIPFHKLVEIGEGLFTAEFNSLDGFGDPARQPGMNRVDGPDTQTCLDCHNKPVVAGGGVNTAINFLLPLESFPFEARNSPHLFGAGAIQLLAREMSAELQTIRNAAISEAQTSGHPVTKDLTTKGVYFGQITANPDGTLDTSAVEGADASLVIRPFNQKGQALSLRTFSLGALNRHHGMQAVEVFGEGDPDDDGVANEITRGDLTAITIFLASRPVPIERSTPANFRVVEQGKSIFNSIGCAECHKPALVLNNPVFEETSPLDPTKAVAFDLTRDGPLPRPRRISDGGAVIQLYGDLKRHDMGPELAESIPSGSVPGSVFITKELWGVGSDGPWLHDGRATTLSEAILAHGGEAEEARDQYADLTAFERSTVVEFLKSLQIYVPR